MKPAIIITSVLLGIAMSRTVWWRTNIDQRAFDVIERWRNNQRNRNA